MRFDDWLLLLLLFMIVAFEEDGGVVIDLVGVSNGSMLVLPYFSDKKAQLVGRCWRSSFDTATHNAKY